MAAILTAYDHATRADDIDAIESAGTVNGQGLSGEFHSWRSGENERDEERLGPRSETSLRLGDHLYVSNANGNVHELRGVLKRRAATTDFIDSGKFVKEPERSRYVGDGTIAGASMWRLEVLPPGGEPVTLWIDAKSGLPVRSEYIDGDGPTYVDLSDWRNVDGHLIAFKSVTTDGAHAFDIVEQTTSAHIGTPIDPAIFAPLQPRRLISDGVQTVPITDAGAHVTTVVHINGKPYTFLIDTGAASILIDSRVAKAAGIAEEGALEVRGAVRAGGLHVAHLPRIAIGDASLDDLVVTTLDLAPSLGPMRIDGILGYSFFASSLVEFDFEAHVMRFGPPGSFEPRGSPIPIDVDREIPEATVRLNDALDAPFIIDTGNSGELMLYGPFMDRHAGIVPPGNASSMAGVGGSAKTYRTHLDTIQLGDVPMYHQNVDVILATQGAFADRIDAGNVGLGVLRNFVTTFDFTNALMYLLPGPAFDDGSRRTVTTP